MVRRMWPRGFTLIELLVVISIIALLVGLLLPALGQARAVAISAQCAADLHGIGTSLANYAGDNADFLPTNNPNDASSAGFQVCYPMAFAGAEIWGTDANIMGEVAYGGQAGAAADGPLGMGILSSPGSAVLNNATYTNLQLQWGNYLPNNMLFCPATRIIQTVTYSTYNLGPTLNGYGDMPWFGNVYGSNWTPNYPYANPTLWVASNYYIPNSYMYRGANLEYYDSANNCLHLDVNNPKTAADSPTVGDAMNLKGNWKWDAPGRTSSRSIAADGGSIQIGEDEATAQFLAAHWQLGGGNILWGDGSASFYKDPDYLDGNIAYPNNNPANNSPGAVQFADPMVKAAGGVNSSTWYSWAPDWTFAQFDYRVRQFQGPQ